MIRVLSAADLRPLMQDASQLEGAFAAIEAAVLQHHRGESGNLGWTELPLAQEGLLIGIYSTARKEDVAIRVFDSRSSGCLHPDAQFMLLMDSHSGQLRALISGHELNVLRTSVPAGVGARHLAPAGARVLCILGSGVQARSHARIFRHALPALERIQVWSPTPANRQRFANETHAALGLPVQAFGGPQEALAGAQVVTLTTPRGKPDIEAGWITHGALIVSITGLAAPEVQRTARLIIPSRARPQLLAVPDWIRGAMQARGDAAPEPLTLAQVMLGEIPARERPDQTVIFGLNAPHGWDAPIMQWALDWAEARHAGCEIPLSDTKAT